MTVAFLLMTSNLLLQATIQCAVFEGRDRDVFIDRREEERMECLGMGLIICIFLWRSVFLYRKRRCLCWSPFVYSGFW